ncbi:MAG: quinolinate synthase NadA [Pseudoflavonifractor sp.]|nr:quinolinate synthase NadA [Alloprevotella sp.]MCM1116038.1 quinolinate synthase NadA [Pseudoflavonifractor sp.]
MCQKDIIEEIKALKARRNACILAHYYTIPEIQDLADHVGDSLALARLATEVTEPVVVMCGVHFMAENVKMLAPEKTVLEPDPSAGCSLADSCPAPDFEAFVKAHPAHTVVSYVNTSAAVKALTDIVVTSGNAREIIDALPADEKIIFGPDRNLGSYINQLTGRQMTLWEGACHVHQQFSLDKILKLKADNPGAILLVHPECPRPIRLIADKIGSTAALLAFARSSSASEFIVATESGILHKMKASCPDKTFIPAPPTDSACACNDCAYMKLNTLEKLRNCLVTLSPEVILDPVLAQKARRPIDRMLEMSKALGL